MIRVMLVDDQDIIRTGLRYVLKAAGDLEVVAEAANGEEALNRMKTHEVDIVLMDLRMPVMNGVEATAHIKQQWPTTQVIVFTTFQEDQDIFDSLKHGASGYLLKDSEPDKIIEAIRTVHEGGALIQPSVANRVISAFSQMQVPLRGEGEDPRIKQLTDKELEVFGHVAKGLNNKEIAEAMYVSEGTVKNHLTNILGKLALRDRTQLAIFGVKNGY